MRDAIQRQAQASPAAALVRQAVANRNAAVSAAPGVNAGPSSAAAVQQPANHGTPYGRGNKVMGGLGVGPSGEAQQPLMSAQHSVSGMRGRRADTLSAEQQMLPGGAMRPRRPQERGLSQQQQQQQPASIEQYQREMQAADQARRGAAQQAGADEGTAGSGGVSILSAPDGGRRMLLTYNSASASSMEVFNSIFTRSTQPHPRLFDWSVEIVDINAPRLPPQNDTIVRQLRQMPQFQREIIEMCVLFDRLKKVAYKDVQPICQVVQAQKDNIVAALVDQQQSGSISAVVGGADGGANGSGTADGRERRGLVREYHSVTQPGAAEKSIKTIARRSVLHGVDPGKLENIAQYEERRIRRDAAGNNSSIHMRRGGAGGGGGGGGGDPASLMAMGGEGGVDMSGVGGTMFEGMGGAYNPAAIAYGARGGGGGEGGDEPTSGFLPQIAVKDLRR